MKTYVVNMIKDTAKRVQIESQLSEHPELEYQIWKAVEGKKLSEDEQKTMISPLFKERYKKGATLPAAGCALSHMSIYRDIVLSKTKYALILEDDAIISENLKLEELTPLLSTNEPVAILLTSDFFYYKKNFVKRVSDNYKVYKLCDAYMTSGYLINFACAQLLLDHIYPVQYTADAWKSFINIGVNLYGIVPHIISFPDGRGEIGQSSLDSKESIFIKMKHMLALLLIQFLWKVKYFEGYRVSKKKWR